MNPRNNLAILFTFCMLHAAAQLPVRYFEITPATVKVTGSLYSSMTYLNSKPDSDYIGMVGIGILKNNDARYLVKTPSDSQMTALLHSMTGDSAVNGSLLFQLKRLGFAETEGARYCYLQAALYSRMGDRYQLLDELDTGFIVTSVSVHTAVNRYANQLIDQFIAGNLTVLPNDATFYGLDDVRHVDSLYKRHLPVYNTPKFKDGFYSNYAAFANQIPDLHGAIETNKGGFIKSIYLIDASGKKVKPRTGALYAIVHDGDAMAITRYGHYQITKVDDNLVFTGDIPISPAPRGVEIAVLQYGLGLLGTLAATTPARETYVLQIDPRTGAFIHLSRLPTPPDD